MLDEMREGEKKGWSLGLAHGSTPKYLRYLGFIGCLMKRGDQGACCPILVMM